MFGPGGNYHVFAGHDCTYSLAVMSLDVTNLDKFGYELGDAEKQMVAGWVQYFDAEYERVGQLDVKHPYGHSDLPKPAPKGKGKGKDKGKGKGKDAKL